MGLSQRDINPLVDKIHSILDIDIDNDQDIVDGLHSISDILPGNTLRLRRGMRCKVEKHQVELYEKFLNEFGAVKEYVERLDASINEMLDTCRNINSQLMDVKHKTNDLITEASLLHDESNKCDAKSKVLDCLTRIFQILPADEEILRSKLVSVDSDFFNALQRARVIEENCKQLMQSGGQNFGLNMLDSVHATLEIAYQSLYQWTQGELRCKTQETPDLPTDIRRSLAVLQERPVLFKYALDEYANARRVATVKSFIDALTLGNDGSSSPHPIGGRSKPIELFSHDPLRYTSDMLAWMHQLTASEREYLDTLTRSCHDGVTTELIAMCLDSVTEGLCFPFKMRVEQLLVSMQDVITLYRINNILRFYEHTLCGVLGPSTRLSATLTEVQELSWRLLFNCLHQYIRQALDQPDYPNSDLSPDDAVRDTLHLILEIIRAHDISLLSKEVREASLSEIVSTLVAPLISYCQNSADRFLLNAVTDTELLSVATETPAIDGLSRLSQRSKSVTYFLNCLYLIETTLAHLDCAKGQIEKLDVLFNASVDTLVAAQVSVILVETRLISVVKLLEKGHDPSRDGPLINRPEAGLSEPEIRNALVHFDVYLSNPDRFCLPELCYVNAQRLRKVVRRRAADDVHSRYTKVYNVLIDPANGYTCFSNISQNQTGVTLRTPQQVAELILNC
ncbi:Conserved oligomeric Golgi complex subunit 6 [Paragonimus heterotremus]|uniref:Conserved oligomeric Golgi complex subunit 6 n=1 Tax=Paragonimus heterotremus TaxID=100268 RepID=A0A8J4WGE5_9TREM|nr:Conserved oligomeric Golgi complex subunit 6 [Paragonimus heterotremus]